MRTVQRSSWVVRRSLVGVSLVVVTVVATVWPQAASSQEGEAAGGSTTTSSSTTSTSTTAAPGVTTTTTTATPSSTTTSSTTTTTAPPEPRNPEEHEAKPEDVPPEPDPAQLPPPAPPPRPPAEQSRINRVVASQVRAARSLVTNADRVHREAMGRRLALEVQQLGLQDRIEKLKAGQREAAAELDAARARLRRRAVTSYLNGPMWEINALLSMEGPNEMPRRRRMVESVIEADRRAVDEYTAAREQVNVDLARTVAELDAVTSALTTARVDEAAAASRSDEARAGLRIVSAGGALAMKGLVFPVAAPYKYGDTFGAPRMSGTEFAHAHQGTDIFAPTGTALVAVERGIVTRLGVDRLGGTKLWILGSSGTRYYYAHLSAYAPGVTEGMVVEPGQAVGYVGNTGNARTTPPHLHFEIHLRGGDVLNPYPILRAIDPATAAPSRTRGRR